MKKIQANILLLVVAVIWGGGFIFVEILLNAGMPAGMITMLRGLVFALCTFVLFFKHIVKMTFADFKVGITAGITNGLGFLLQAIGQSYTSPSHAALITVIYVVMVPVFCWIFYRIRPKIKTAISVFLCVLGAIVLVNGVDTGFGGKVLLGDFLVFLSAIMFGANMAYLGHSGKETHYGTVSFFMGAVLFLLSLIYVLIFRETYIPKGNVWKIIASVAYLGILSSSLCQILQVVCQRYTSPVSASMIMTLEGFFGGVLALFYSDTLSWHLVVGGLIIVISLLLHEFDFSALKGKRKKRE